MAASDYERSTGGRGEDFGADDRSWIDVCADDECEGRPHHAGKGPKTWSRSDQALYEEICERLLRDPLIDARGVSVDVTDGVVAVRGQAAAPADPALIQRLVRETPGVKGAEFDLTVRPRGAAAVVRPQPPEDDDSVDKSSLAAPLLARRAPPPDSAGAP
jgi:hypothetical protein